MKFNPNLNFGTIGGIDDVHPTARYQQGVYLYNAHRKCLNPEVAAPATKTVSEAATAELCDKLQDEADDLVGRIQVAKRDVDLLGTAIAKSILTKLTNKYAKVIEKLEQLDNA